MILRVIFIVACLQATILSAQTEDQKKLIFERINQDAKGNVVLRKTKITIQIHIRQALWTTKKKGLKLTLKNK